MTQHALYAPSSAKRWTVCTASAEAIAVLPEQEEGEAAAEGTAAHAELERVLNGGAQDPDHPAAYIVALTVDYIRQLPPGKMFVEQRVELTPHIWGRCDIAHFDGETLTVIDMKNGFVGVDAKANEQMMIYAAASIYTHNLAAKRFRLVIVQPRDFRPVPSVKQWPEKPEEWSDCTVDKLYEFAKRVAAIPAGPKQFVAGEHCRYCPLFGRCEPTRDLLQHLSVALQHTPDEVRSDQVAAFMLARKPIEDYFKALDREATKRAMSGADVPGMKLVQTMKHRAWKPGKEDEVRALILEKCGPEGLDVPTPAQAEKLGLDVEALTERPDGGPALAFESDKRKAWARKSAEDMFKDVVGRQG